MTSPSTAWPAAVASGFPESVPAWYTGPVGASCRAHGPAAERADGQAAADHLAEAPQVGRDPDIAVAPPTPSRKPVITSSKMRSAPTRSHAARSPSKNPGAGATRFMLAATGSTISTATESVELGHRVVLDDQGVGDRGPGHTGRAGPAEHGHPAAAPGQHGVGVTVVAAVELHHAVAPGDPPRQPEHAHGGLGPRRHQPDPLASRHPGADVLGQEHLAGGGRAEGRPACRRLAIASVTTGWAWPSRMAP